MRNFEKITALYERLSRDDELQGERVTLSSIRKKYWKNTQAKIICQTSFTLQMMESVERSLTDRDLWQ